MPVLNCKARLATGRPSRLFSDKALSDVMITRCNPPTDGAIRRGGTVFQGDYCSFIRFL